MIAAYATYTEAEVQQRERLAFERGAFWAELQMFREQMPRADEYPGIVRVEAQRRYPVMPSP